MESRSRRTGTKRSRNRDENEKEVGHPSPKKKAIWHCGVGSALAYLSEIDHKFTHYIPELHQYGSSQDVSCDVLTTFRHKQPNSRSAVWWDAGNLKIHLLSGVDNNGKEFTKAPDIQFMSDQKKMKAGVIFRNGWEKYPNSKISKAGNCGCTMLEEDVLKERLNEVMNTVKNGPQKSRFVKALEGRNPNLNFGKVLRVVADVQMNMKKLNVVYGWKKDEAIVTIHPRVMIGCKASTIVDTIIYSLIENESSRLNPQERLGSSRTENSHSTFFRPSPQYQPDPTENKHIISTPGTTPTVNHINQSIFNSTVRQPNFSQNSECCSKDKCSCHKKKRKKRERYSKLGNRQKRNRVDEVREKYRDACHEDEDHVDLISDFAQKELTERELKMLVEKIGVSKRRSDEPKLPSLSDSMKMLQKVINEYNDSPKIGRQQRNRDLMKLISHFPISTLESNGLRASRTTVTNSRNERNEGPRKPRPTPAQDLALPKVQKLMKKYSRISANRWKKNSKGVSSPALILTITRNRFSRLVGCSITTLNVVLKKYYGQVVKSSRSLRKTDVCDLCNLYHRIDDEIKKKNEQIDIKSGLISTASDDETLRKLRKEVEGLRASVKKLGFQMEFLEAHRKIKDCQNECFESDWEDENIGEGDLVMIIDYKENIALGLGPVEEGRNFYDTPQRMVFGLVMKYRDGGEVVKERHIVYSQILNKSSLVAFKCVTLVFDDLFFRKPYLKKKLKHLNTWADKGPHYYSKEYLYYSLVKFPEEYGFTKSTVQFFAAKHGKGEVDGMFSRLSMFLQWAAMNEYILTDEHFEDVVDRMGEEFRYEINVTRLDKEDFTDRELTYQDYLEIEKLKTYSWYQVEKSEESDVMEDEDDKSVVVRFAVTSKNINYHTDKHKGKIGTKKKVRKLKSPVEFKLGNDSKDERNNLDLGLGFVKNMVDRNSVVYNDFQEEALVSDEAIQYYNEVIEKENVEKARRHQEYLAEIRRMRGRNNNNNNVEEEEEEELEEEDEDEEEPQRFWTRKSLSHEEFHPDDEVESEEEELVTPTTHEIPNKRWISSVPKPLSQDDNDGSHDDPISPLVSSIRDEDDDDDDNDNDNDNDDDEEKIFTPIKRSSKRKRKKMSSNQVFLMEMEKEREEEELEKKKKDNMTPDEIVDDFMEDIDEPLKRVRRLLEKNGSLLMELRKENDVGDNVEEEEDVIIPPPPQPQTVESDPMIANEDSVPQMSSSRIKKKKKRRRKKIPSLHDLQSLCRRPSRYSPQRENLAMEFYHVRAGNLVVYILILCYDPPFDALYQRT